MATVTSKRKFGIFQIESTKNGKKFENTYCM